VANRGGKKGKEVSKVCKIHEERRQSELIDTRGEKRGRGEARETATNESTDGKSVTRRITGRQRGGVVRAKKTE